VEVEMPGSRVLVVDDEEALRHLAVAYLAADGHEVAEASDGAEALEVARAFRPDLVVLDLGLPRLHGLDVCRELRQTSDCYVVMVTARDDEETVIAGLRVGADDFLTKPVSPRELVARVEARLRRPSAASRATEGVASADPLSRVRHVGALAVDVDARTARLGADVLGLTRTEFDILATLATRPGLVLTRRQLIDEVWGRNWHGDDHLVDAHIVHLRRKLGDDPATGQYVRTVRGVGYRLGEG
jgi:DNA-binding response OmpR family regulator